jgi:hypothetical protein
MRPTTGVPIYYAQKIHIKLEADYEPEDPGTIKGQHRPVISRLSDESWHELEDAMQRLAAGQAVLNLGQGKPHHLVTLEVRGVQDGLSCSVAQEHPLMRFVEEHAILRLAETALNASGQMSYLRKNSDQLLNAHCGIRLHVQYTGQRDCVAQAFLHKDGGGTTFFTNLMYLNSKTIPGPEIVLNPKGLKPDMEARLRKRLPDWLVDKIMVASRGWHGEEMLASNIPAHGAIGFMNAFCCHTSPFPGSRGVELEVLEKSLGMCLRDRTYKYSKGTGLAIRKLIDDRKAKKADKLYKADLLEAGVCEADADALLKFFDAKPLDKVRITETKNDGSVVAIEIPLIPVDDPPSTLKRQASISRGSEPYDAGADEEPRAFMSVLVEVYDKDKAGG